MEQRQIYKKLKKNFDPGNEKSQEFFLNFDLSECYG